MSSKAELRERFVRVRASIPPGDRERAEGALFPRLAAEFPAARARTVALFASFSDEVPTDRLIEGMRAEGRRLLLPRVRPRDHGPREMVLCEFSALDALGVDRFGIRSPDGPEWSGEVDLVVVPGLAFGHDGSRLGYGGGFYDRLLGQGRFRRSTLCGLAFDQQVVPSLPVEAHDVLLDHVATPTQTIVCAVRR